MRIVYILGIAALFTTGCASRQALSPPLADGSSASVEGSQPGAAKNPGKADNGKPCPKAAAAANPSGG